VVFIWILNNKAVFYHKVVVGNQNQLSKIQLAALKCEHSNSLQKNKYCYNY